MTTTAAISGSTGFGRNGPEAIAPLDQVAAPSSALAVPRTAAPEA
ncbi:hypothetical protein [Streptomyces atratus]|nr:hypothetical protein [Streptomyces atratus]MCX5338721.1 hypothetical protein [Streptomyces atratus]